MSAVPKLNYKKLVPHPLGALLPPMADPEYDKLKEDLKKHGYDKKKPIILFEDKILDGNNRYTACAGIRGVEPVFEVFEGTVKEAVELVVRNNLARRNLNPSQSAAIGADLVEAMEEAELEAKAAAKAAKQAGKKAEKVKVRGTGEKTARAAKVVGVSARSVAKAKALKAADPKQFAKVKKGELKLNSAAKKAEAKISEKARQTEEFAKAKAHLEKIISADFAHTAENKLKSKDFIHLSGLEKAEIIRIQPLIEAGWTLSASLGYKSVQLSPVHPMRQFINRCIAQNGSFSWTCKVEGKEFRADIIEIK
jgi:hypothetical protein